MCRNYDFDQCDDALVHDPTNADHNPARPWWWIADPEELERDPQPADTTAGTPPPAQRLATSTSATRERRRVTQAARIAPGVRIRIRIHGTQPEGYTAHLVDEQTGATVRRTGPYAHPDNARTAGHLLASSLELPVTGDERFQ